MAITFAGAEIAETQVPFEGNDGVEQVVETSGEGIPPAEEQSEGQESPVPEQESTEAPTEQPSLPQEQPESPSQEPTTQPQDSSLEPTETLTVCPSDEASAEARRKRIVAQVLWRDACDKKSAHVGSLALEVAKAKSRLKSAQDAFNEEVEELQELVDRDYYPFLENEGSDGDGSERSTSEDVSDVRSGAVGVLRSGVADDSADHAGGVDQPAASEAAPTRWQDRPLVELVTYGAPKSTIETLVEQGYETIGRFEQLRADISNRREKWPKGIGEAKVTKLENAIVEWGSRNWPQEGELEATATSAPVVTQDATPDAPAAGTTSESPPAVAAQPEAASESAAVPEPAAEVAAKPKRTRKKKEPVAEQTVEQVAEQAAETPPARPTDHLKFEMDGRSIPTIGQWDQSDNRDRIEWMKARMAVLQSMHAAGAFRPAFPAEVMKGKLSGNNNGTIGSAAILQPGERMDSWLYGFSLSSQVAAPQPASVPEPVASSQIADDVDLADL